MTSWSTGTLVNVSGSYGGQAVSSSIRDAYMVKVGTNYYLWYTDQLRSATVAYADCGASRTSPCTVVKHGLWGTFSQQYQEGSTIVQMSDRWRLYFDQYNNTLNNGNIKFSDSFDNWATWSNGYAINSDMRSPGELKHGTVFKAPSGSEPRLPNISRLPVRQQQR